jgi:hypothetical protein
MSEYIEDDATDQQSPYGELENILAWTGTDFIDFQELSLEVRNAVLAWINTRSRMI